jgi:hypothetical protein
MREEDTYSEIMRIRRNNQIVRRASLWVVIPILCVYAVIVAFALAVTAHFVWKYW